MEQKTPRTPRRFSDRFIHLIESAPLFDRTILRIAFFCVIVSGLWVLLSVNSNHTSDTPTPGGSLHEGMLGTPRFVNPTLAFTRADQDVTALVYSGLMRIDADGQLIPDLAESVSVSEDGRTYTIAVRKDAVFHDGTPVTARDAAFTYALIQDPVLKSPLRGNWTDVIITEVDEYTLSLTLEEAYAPFIENLTIGLLPAHIWSDLPVEQIPFSQLNTEPVGAGLYEISDAKRDTSGLITSYTLTAFAEHHRSPNIKELALTFYKNEAEVIEALKQNHIDSTAYAPTDALPALSDTHQVLAEPLPRLFGLFLNQNRSSALRDDAVREALAAAIDREALVQSVVAGYGVPTATPLPSSITAVKSTSSATTASTSGAMAAQAILTEAGWTKNNIGLYERTIDGDTVTLELTIRTSNTPVFAAMVDNIAAAWEAAGIAVATEQFEQTGLVQSVIRPRDFEVLLFGLDMSRSYDLYPFWHSSQQGDPGLNISQYANVAVDDLLEVARTTQNDSERLEILKNASTEIATETPAILLFQPEFSYVVAEDVSVTPVTRIGKPSDRFSTIHTWYTEEESLWPWFRNN